MEPKGAREKLPALQVLRHYPREVLTAMGARFAENVSYYVFTIVITSYLVARYDSPTSFVLGAVLIVVGVLVSELRPKDLTLRPRPAPESDQGADRVGLEVR